MTLEDDALAYHASGRPGKLEVVPTKPCALQRDLSLAYTPGVAEPCRAIQRDPALAYRYTGRGNLVAVISNGTAVLGLGDIGPLAGKPVMEGKAVLFKKFADIDVFDLEIDTKDPDRLVDIVRSLEPTFGGINLEDIAAPACFEVEKRLMASMSIPVFHDDQHGTAIISSAALINGLELARKDPANVRIVVCGAGAAGIASCRLYLSWGVKREQIILCDKEGVIYRGPGLVTPGMLATLAPHPIILAMANPDPEITYPEAKKARPDAIVATGRSDFPNQVNNVLGFPFIFRGALDVQARAINTDMKIAAMRALADLAKHSVPDSVARAYGGVHFQFGPDYIIPKPFDPRVLLWESVAVARAAMASGVARRALDLSTSTARPWKAAWAPRARRCASSATRPGSPPAASCIRRGRTPRS